MEPVLITIILTIVGWPTSAIIGKIVTETWERSAKFLSKKEETENLNNEHKNLIDNPELSLQSWSNKEKEHQNLKKLRMPVSEVGKKVNRCHRKTTSTESEVIPKQTFRDARIYVSTIKQALEQRYEVRTFQDATLKPTSTETERLSTRAHIFRDLRTVESSRAEIEGLSAIAQTFEDARMLKLSCA